MRGRVGRGQGETRGRRARGPFDTRSVMAMQGLSPTMGERNERRGSIALVLLVAAGLIAAAAGLMLVGRNQAGSYVMFLLAVLGMIGVFSLFALAAGVLRISGREASGWVLEQVFEHAHEGIVVTDANGRVLCANAAYRAFSGATGMRDVRPIERVFVGDPDVSETLYRLLKASRDGRRLQEEVRVPRPRAPGERVPGVAACDRLSGSCACRLFLGRWRRRRRLHQCHARGLARSRSRPDRRRGAPAGRSSAPRHCRGIRAR